MKNNGKERGVELPFGKNTIYWISLIFHSVCEIWVYRHIQCFCSSWYYGFTKKEGFLIGGPNVIGDIVGRVLLPRNIERV